MRRSYVRNAVKAAPEGYVPTSDDIAFLAADTNTTPAAVETMLAELAAKEA
jgi:alkylated DNA nucleotide flippase Atl1